MHANVCLCVCVRARACVRACVRVPCSAGAYVVCARVWSMNGSSSLAVTTCGRLWCSCLWRWLGRLWCSCLDTRGCLRVDGKPGLATLAHGRAVSGAGGAGFGITVRASALVRRLVRRCTDKNMGFHHSPASNQTGVCIVISYSPILTFVPLGLVCNVGVIPNCHILTQ